VLQDERPFNFAALNNLAADQTSSDFLCLLNNDIEVIQPDWLDELVSQLQRPDVGAVGAKLLFPNRTVQHAGVVLGMGGVGAHGHRGLAERERGYFGRASLAQELSAVTAACLLVRREAWRAVGGMDADKLAVAYNDVDFCLRLSDAGYRIVFTPFALLLHHESVSRGDDRTPEQRRRFEQEVATMHQRWGESLQQDPYFNPNLSLTSSDYVLAWPPRLDRWPVPAV
jgi:GT2 family glycosyltransferase